MKRRILKFPETFKVTCLIKSPKRYDISELIKTIGNKIFGYTEAHIMVQYNDNVLDHFSTEDCELQALLDKSKIPHTYNLIIRSNTQESLETIICHEMKHFDQYERGDLELRKDSSGLVFVYKDKEYKASSDYFSRPWEKEARLAENILWKEFKKLYYE